jgi:hypothetical protein
LHLCFRCEDERGSRSAVTERQDVLGKTDWPEYFSLTFFPDKDLAILDEVLPLGFGESVEDPRKRTKANGLEQNEAEGLEKERKASALLQILL